MIVHNMPAAEYHAHPALSSSLVKRAVDSTPAHVAEYARSQDRQSKAMALGTITHAAILEPDTLERDYFIAPLLPRNTKVGKQAFEFAEDMAQHQGQTLVSLADFDKARWMRDSVQAHPEARMVLRKGRAEVSVFVTDPDSGCELRSREDWKPESDVIVDLKTARTAGRWFANDAFRLGYPISAHHYRRCREIETGVTCEFMWVVVETDPPFAVHTYYADDDTLVWAELRWTKAIDALQRAAWACDWHGYPTETKALPMPGWARNELENAPVELIL